MSLADAVTMIADAMYDVATELRDVTTAATMMKSFSMQLRVAVKAAGESTAPVLVTKEDGLVITKRLANSPFDKKIEDLKTREIQRLEEAKQEAMMRESTGTRMALCADGPEQDLMAEINPNMPAGARCYVGDPGKKQVYELRSDGMLYFDELSTQSHRRS